MSIYWQNLIYSNEARADLALGLAAYIDQGAGVATIEYHEVGGAAQGLLATFELSDPSYTAADGVLTLRVSPAVKAVVAPGITAAEPDYYYLKNAEGNVVGEGTLTRTAAEQVDTGDILSFASMQINVALASPLQIPGLAAWYSDQVTGAGTAGFQVLDLSGNGNHATQTDIARQPTSSGGVLNFSHALHQYAEINTSSFLINQAKFVVVARARALLDVPAVTQALLSNDSNQPRFVYLRQTGGSLTGDLEFTPTALSANLLSIDNPLIDAATEFVATYVFDSGVHSVRLNSVPLLGPSAAGVADSGNTAELFLGTALPSGTNFSWDGSMRNVFIVAGRIPTETELTFLENYL